MQKKNLYCRLEERMQAFWRNIKCYSEGLIQEFSLAKITKRWKIRESRTRESEQLAQSECFNYEWGARELSVYMRFSCIYAVDVDGILVGKTVKVRNVASYFRFLIRKVLFFISGTFSTTEISSVRFLSFYGEKHVFCNDVTIKSLRPAIKMDLLELIRSKPQVRGYETLFFSSFACRATTATFQVLVREVLN